MVRRPRGRWEKTRGGDPVFGGGIGGSTRRGPTGKTAACPGAPAACPSDSHGEGVGPATSGTGKRADKSELPRVTSHPVSTAADPAASSVRNCHLDFCTAATVLPTDGSTAEQGSWQHHATPHRGRPRSCGRNAATSSAPPLRVPQDPGDGLAGLVVHRRVGLAVCRPVAPRRKAAALAAYEARSAGIA